MLCLLYKQITINSTLIDLLHKYHCFSFSLLFSYVYPKQARGAKPWKCRFSHWQAPLKACHSYAINFMDACLLVNPICKDLWTTLDA